MGELPRPRESPLTEPVEERAGKGEGPELQQLESRDAAVMRTDAPRGVVMEGDKPSPLLHLFFWFSSPGIFPLEFPGNR